MKFGMVRGLVNGHLFPEFAELWLTFFEGHKNFKQGIYPTFLSERNHICQR